MARLTKQLQRAQTLALRGDTDGALTAFSELKRKGEASASAALAEIAAYRGQWDVVLENASTIVAAPEVASVLNIYTDMLLLCARAIARLGRWAEGRKLVSTAMEKVSSMPDYEDYSILIQRLSEFVTCKGEGAQFLDANYFALGEPEESLAERKAQFDEALAELAAEAMKKRAPSAEDIDDAYALASTYQYKEGAVEIFDRVRTWPSSFEDTLFTAAALARAGRPEEAWDGIQTRLKEWWPPEDTQVAPVELIGDEPLNRLMGPERCAEVLRTPRGPEAEGA